MLEILRELKGGLDDKRSAEALASILVAQAIKSDVLNDILIKESEAKNNDSKIIV